ncbi:YceD family protein [Actinomycetes bacterium KLBMP 9797]
MPNHPQIHLDPRSPLVLDTRELPRRPGSMRTVNRVIPAPADLGVELIRVPEGADLVLDLRMESVSEGVLVSGTASGPVTGECGRCLREIDDSVTVTIQELYAYEHSTTDETADEHEVGRLQGDLIDLEPVLRDAVVLALPSNPLCRDDCPGLCPECGVHWDDLPADHSHQEVDPRWAALSRLNRKEE